MNIEVIKSLKERAKEMLEDNYNRKIGDEEIYTIICELENFYTAYEKEKEKNKELDEQNFKYTTKIALLQTEVEELDKENTRQHELIGKIHKKWEDKIKAILEEYKYTEIGDSERIIEFYKKMQLLLEKE